MFVVSPVMRRPVQGSPELPPKLSWPVVFEDQESGGYTQSVAQGDSREAAQKIADDLNAVLESAASSEAGLTEEETDK